MDILKLLASPYAGFWFSPDHDGAATEPEDSTTSEEEAADDAITSEEADETEIETEDDSTTETEEAEESSTDEEAAEDSEREDSEQPEVEFEEPEKFKGKSREEIIGSYQNLEKLLSKKTQPDELKQPEQAQPTPTEPASESPATEEVDEYGLTEKEKERLEEVAYDKGAWAASAEYNKIMQQKQEVSQINELEREATEYNQSLARTFARRQMYEAAKEAGKREDLERFAKANTTITQDDLKNYPHVQEQLLSVLDIVENDIQKIPLRVNGKVIPGKFMYQPDAFDKALRLASFDSTIAKTRQRTAEEVVDSIKKGQPGARIARPTTKEKAELGVRFSGSEDADEATLKALDMSEADRLKYLDG